MEYPVRSGMSDSRPGKHLPMIYPKVPHRGTFSFCALCRGRDAIRCRRFSSWPEMTPRETRSSRHREYMKLALCALTTLHDTCVST